MSRRILYNPVDFVDRATPFYENIIGIISDQTERISRNIELAREERRIEDDRLWQEDMLQRQLGARREMHQEQIEFQGEQSRLQRHQQHMQYLGNQMMATEKLRLGWAKLGIQQMEAARKAEDTRLRDAQREFNDAHSRLRKAGFLDVSEPRRLELIPSPETGEFGLFDYSNRDDEGIPAFRGELDAYMDWYGPLLSFIEQDLRGQNIEDWADDYLADGDTYVDAMFMGDEEPGKIIVDKKMVLNYADKLRIDPNNEKARDFFIKLANRDESLHLLRKDSPESDIRDPFRVIQDVTYSVGNMVGLENWMGTIFDPDRLDRFVDKKYENNPEKYMIVPWTMTFNNIPNIEFQGQTLGEMHENLARLREDYKNDDRIDTLQRSVNKIQQLAGEYYMHNAESLPEHLKGVSYFDLLRSLRINKEEALSPQPRIQHLFDYPLTREEVLEAGESYAGQNIYEAEERRREHREMQLELDRNLARRGVPAAHFRFRYD